MKVHPLAELFPLLEGKEFEELVEDIRKNGLRTPILRDQEERILDGRNRMRACPLAGVEPRFETWDGKGSVAEVIISLNLRRRHLNESQRAMLAAKLLEANGLDGTSANLRSGPSAGQAAEMLNVSTRSVEHARKVLRSGNSRLVQAVQSGEMAVSTAAGDRRRRRAKPKLPDNDIMLTLWARPDGIEEAREFLEERGFEYRGVILVGSRRHAPAA